MFHHGIRTRSVSRRWLLCQGSALLGVLGATSSCSAPPEHADGAFEPIDQLAREAVTSGQGPGVVLAIGHGGYIVHRYVCGARATLPKREPLTWDTRFDLASLTKPIVTGLAVMQLVEQSRLDLDDPVTTILPAFGNEGKGDITPRLLLTHYSGLPPDLLLAEPWQGKAEAVRRIMTCRPILPPGERFIYSDINFLVLGLVVERVSGLPLDRYARKRIFAPLGMTHSCFRPDPALMPAIAPTQFDEYGTMLRGVVHDPTARRMGGVAGNAGLFSSADDLSLYAQSLLDRLSGHPSRFPLGREFLTLMTTPQQPGGKTDLRGLGWDIATHYSTPRGACFSSRSFGHTGFTGTSLWIDPPSASYVLIMTNRVHPNGGHSVVALRQAIATRAAQALGVGECPSLTG